MIYRRLAGMEENIFAKLVYIFAESGNRKNVHFTVRLFSRKIKLIHCKRSNKYGKNYRSIDGKPA